MISHGSRKKAIFALSFGLMILLISFFLWRRFVPVKGVSVTYLSKLAEDRERLNDLNFDVLFGAPHYNGFEVYRYQDGKFYDSPNRYDSSPSGEESMRYLDWIIAKDDSITNYSEMRDQYGQVNRIKEKDGLVYVLFDGYLTERGSDTHKINRLVTIHPQTEQYQVTEISFPALEFFHEMEPMGGSMFFVTRTENYIGEKGKYERVLYEWKDNVLEREVIFQSDISFSPWTVYIKNGILYFGYVDENRQEVIRAIRLEDRSELAELTMPAGSESEYLYYAGDRLKIYSKGKGEAIYVTETDAYLRQKDRYVLEADKYWEINKVFEYQGEIYVVLSGEESNVGIIYKQKEKKLEKLLSFARRKKDLFYYNLYFFGGEGGNYLGR